MVIFFPDVSWDKQNNYQGLGKPQETYITTQFWCVRGLSPWCLPGCPGYSKGPKNRQCLASVSPGCRKICGEDDCSSFCFIRKLLTVPRHFLLFLQPSFLKSEIAFWKRFSPALINDQKCSDGFSFYVCSHRSVYLSSQADVLCNWVWSNSKVASESFQGVAMAIGLLLKI